MDPISCATSSWGPPLVMMLCRVLPRGTIHCLGGWLSACLSRRGDLAFVQALSANLAVVHGLPEWDSRVRKAVALLLKNTIVSYADLFWMLQSGTPEGRMLCQLDPGIRQAIEGCLATRRGLVLVGAHMCSFDILLFGLRQVFPAVQILTNADPRGSSQFMNRLRMQHGLLVTPLSVGSLRQAMVRLCQGGVVAIAADIPVEGGEPLTFFGRSSHLPVGHTRLALDTGSHVLVGVSHRVDEGSYRAEVALAPRPESSGDRKQDAVRWAQASLHLLEGFIRRWPHEWLMPHPVWSTS
ncbi:MAG TPA: lysophospholipid acyltransferase family protein [Anaerolineae bacterium]|nr:lysophospholipid acyltransferase family protein [Anaerolineae bacterium]